MDRDKHNQSILVVEELHSFNDWMYSQIKPFLGGNILEVGSGMGRYSEKVAKDFKNSKIILSDIDEEYLNILRKRFERYRNVVSIVKVDLRNSADLSKIGQKVHSAFAVNVLEHIQDDVSALNNVHNILESKGRFVLLIPAHKHLFNCIDRIAGHYRRYTKTEMEDKVAKTGFDIEKVFYFNFLSIFAWYVYGNILKREILDRKTTKVLDRIVPVLRFVENHILRKKIGISLVVVLVKK